MCLLDSGRRICGLTSCPEGEQLRLTLSLSSISLLLYNNDKVIVEFISGVITYIPPQVSSRCIQASWGLYHRAIIQSGCDDPYVPASGRRGENGYPTAMETYRTLLNLTQCDSWNCLLGMSSSEIFNAMSVMGDVWGPVIDGTSLTDRPQVPYRPNFSWLRAIQHKSTQLSLT